MAEQKTSFQKDSRPLIEKATSVVRKLQSKGFETYFAGGCVRDMLLGISPKDFDIATAALPEDVVAAFPNAMSRARDASSRRRASAGRPCGARGRRAPPMTTHILTISSETRGEQSPGRAGPSSTDDDDDDASRPSVVL